MTFQAFNQTLSETNPPQNISEILEALWYDAKEDWESAIIGMQTIGIKEPKPICQR